MSDAADARDRSERDIEDAREALDEQKQEVVDSELEDHGLLPTPKGTASDGPATLP